MADLVKYISVTNSIFELLSVFIILSAITGKKPVRGGGIFHIAVMVNIIAANFFGVSNCIYLFNYLLVTGAAVRIYRMGVLRAAVYSIFGIVFVSVMELAVYVFLRFITYSWPQAGEYLSIPAVLLTFLLCLVIYRKKVFAVVRQMIIRRDKRTYAALLVLSVLVIETVSILKYKDGLDLSEAIYIIIMMGFISLFFYTVGYFRHILKLQKEYSGRYEEVIMSIRARQHKFMNQIDSIYSLIELYDNYDDLAAKQMEELENLKRYMMPNKILVLDNPIVIAHVYKKMCDADDLGIDMVAEFACSLKNITVPDIILIEIIGNLLDNAIDEVNGRNRGEKIYLSIKNEMGLVCIMVFNEHEKIPQACYSRFFEYGYSTKGEGRGEGLPYVKRLVNKYGGTIDVGNREINHTNCFGFKVLLKP